MGWGIPSDWLVRQIVGFVLEHAFIDCMTFAGSWCGSVAITINIDANISLGWNTIGFSAFALVLGNYAHGAIRAWASGNYLAYVSCS